MYQRNEQVWTGLQMDLMYLLHQSVCLLEIVRPQFANYHSFSPCSWLRGTEMVGSSTETSELAAGEGE